MKQNQKDAPGNLNGSDKEHKQLVDTEHTNFRINMT